jgi:hypothetical protein
VASERSLDKTVVNEVYRVIVGIPGLPDQLPYIDCWQDVIFSQPTWLRPCLKEDGQIMLCEWKQPKSPTTNEWIREMWYLYTMEFYAAMKKNEMLSFTGKWMELESIILSEVSLAQKTKNHMFSLICGH